MSTIVAKIGTSSLTDERGVIDLGAVARAVSTSPPDEGVEVVRDRDGAWRVAGRDAERVVAVTDLTDADALAYVRDRFRRLGVDRALLRAGARDGADADHVAVELEYVEDPAGR